MADNIDVSSAVSINNSPHDMLQLPSAQVGSIEDILSSICQNLIHDTFELDNAQQKQDRATLFSAAQAFRTMYEPALNALWHTIPSIELLICLLDCVAWNGVEYMLSSSQVDWTRFDHHARRVRAVHIPDGSVYVLGERERVPPSLVHFLERTRRSFKIVLPCVISVYIPSGGCVQNSALSFISSSLRTLKIGTKGRLSFSLTLLHLVQRECFHLQEHTILDADSDLILESVGRMKGLKRLELNISGVPLSEAFLTTLAASNQGLEHLTISSSSMIPSGPTATARQRLTVSTIKLTGPLFPVFQYICPNHLEEIAVHYVNKTNENKRDEETWEYLIDQISGFQRLTSLEVDYRTPFSMVDLMPLCNMPFASSLRTLTFEQNTMVTALTNDSIGNLTAALPSMEWLALPYVSITPGQQCPTLEVLHDIACNCPLLETLIIHVDSLSSMPPPPNAVTGKTHPLSLLGISEDPNNPTPPKLSSLVAITRNLLKCFPDLKTVTAYAQGKVRDNAKEKCDTITELLALLRERA